MHRLPSLNALKAFEVAARHGSFSRAALELHVTPAAVSHQVKALEDYLGLSLFNRHSRGLKLTRDGSHYAEALSKGFDQLAAASHVLGEVSSKGVLKVNVHPGFAASWLAPRIGDFKSRYPDIDIYLVSDPRMADFADPELDVAIRYGDGDFPGLDARLLTRELVFPICSPALLNSPLPLHKLANIRHFTLIHDAEANLQEPSISWLPWLKMAKLPEDLAHHGIGFNDPLAILEAAIGGHGIAIGRSVLLERHLAAGRLIRLFTESLPAAWAYYFVGPVRNMEDPKVQTLWKWLLAQQADTLGYGDT